MAGSSGNGPSIQHTHAGTEPLTASLAVSLGTAPAAGDVIVAFVADDSAVILPSGGGWKIADSYANGNMTINVAYRVAQSGDTGNYTFANTATGHYASYSIYEIANASTANPINVAAHVGVAAHAATFATSSVTPSGYLSLPIAAVANFGDAAASPAPWTNQSGWNQDQYTATFELETLSGPTTTTMTGAVSETSTSNYPSAYPGFAEIVLVNSQPKITLDGCQVFPQQDPVYNSRIDNLSTDPSSSTQITGYTGKAGDEALSSSSNAWFINAASSPTYSAMYNDAGQKMSYVSAPVPFSSSMNWEGKPSGNGDHHLMVLNTSSCVVTEGYTSRQDSTTSPSWYVNSSNQLVQNYGPLGYANQWTLSKAFAQEPGSVNLGGLPQFAGIIRKADIDSGCICHALNMDVVNAGLSNTNYSYPAKGPGSSGDLGSLYDGAHLRLKLSVTAQSVCGTPEQSSNEPCYMIVTALHDYGAYVMDQGSVGDGEVVYVESTDQNGTWTPAVNSTNLSYLNQHLKMSNLEVVPPPAH